MPLLSVTVTTNLSDPLKYLVTSGADTIIAFSTVAFNDFSTGS